MANIIIGNPLSVDTTGQITTNKTFVKGVAVTATANAVLSLYNGTANTDPCLLRLRALANDTVFCNIPFVSGNSGIYAEISGTAALAQVYI